MIKQNLTEFIERDKKSNKLYPFKCIRTFSQFITFAMATVFAALVYIHSNVTLPWNIKNALTECSNVSVSNKCVATLFPKSLNTEENWGQVDINKTIYAISAYHVEERERVFIIGTKPFYNETIICQLWYSSPENSTGYVRQTLAKVVAPSGATGYSFTSTIFECKVETTEKPKYVSLVKNSCDNPLNALKVQQASKPVKYKRRFTVCLSPVFKYNDTFQMVEWIELNRILGAEKFILYDYSTSANVKNVIDYYVKLGVMEEILWKIPFPHEGDIEYFAQKAAINDCIFRNKHVSEFIVNIDKDEYIIPHSYDIITWSQLINTFDKNYAGYLVRHSFFRLDWKLEHQNFSEKLLAQKRHLVTLTHFQHEKKIWPPNHRSKYFARTEVVEFGNVHEIPRGRILFIPPDVALLHHYRAIGNPQDVVNITDFTVLVKYGDILTRNVQKTWNDLSFN